MVATRIFLKINNPKRKPRAFAEVRGNSFSGSIIKPERVFTKIEKISNNTYNYETFTTTNRSLQSRLRKTA